MIRTCTILASVLLLLFASAAFAVESNPTPEQIKQAVERGRKAVANPETLYKGYEFGERGVGVNGYVMSKLFQIAHRSAEMSAKKTPITDESFTDILKQDYLLFPIYLFASSRSELEKPVVKIRQGTKILDSNDFLMDPIEQAFCQKDVCYYKRDVYAGFYFEKFDAKRLVVLVIISGSLKAEFPLALKEIQ